MTGRLKNILIGVFVIASLSVTAGLILFLKPQVGDGNKILHVRFTNITGIVIGTRVTFAGKPVGEVIHIREIANARTMPDELGRVYFYELTLKTDSNVEIYETDEIAVRSTGLMGEKSVAILPKATASEKAITNTLIYANSTDPLENTFQQIAKTASRMESSIHQFDTWFRDHSEILSSSVHSLDHTISCMKNTFAAVEENGLVPLLRETADLLNDSLRSLQSSLCEDRLLHTVANVSENVEKITRSFYDDAIPTLEYLRQIAHDLADGSGTIGRLLARDDCYLHFSSLLSKAETLMNDINHYGVLFQYDKHWQRSRTKKANFLKALDTPKEFRAYFEGEIDAITTSLGRLGDLLDRAEDHEEHILENDLFKKQFSTLLRHAQSLTDTIKLYNEHLTDSDMASSIPENE